MYDEKGEKETVMAAEKKIRVVPDPVYRSTDISEIELIRPLWEQLNDHHRRRARAFRNMYDQWTFDDRKKHFTRVAALGPLRIDLAADPLTGRYIGYCISSLSPEKTGEIESVFVVEDYRQRGVGKTLLARALSWLDTSGSVRNRVSVADGNEEASSFYWKFGFYPRMTVLEQKNTDSWE